MPKITPKTAKDIFSALDSSNLVYYGLVRRSEDDDHHILFLPHNATGPWTKIPTKIIDGIECIGQPPVASVDQHFVKLTVQRPVTSEAMAYLNLPTISGFVPGAPGSPVGPAPTGAPTRQCYDSKNDYWYPC